MKRLLFTALLWTVALHAQGRMGGAVRGSSSAPARSSAPHYSAPSGGYRSAPAARPMPMTRTATAQPAARPVTRSAGSALAPRSFAATASGHRGFVSAHSNRFHHGHHFRSARSFAFAGLNTGCLNGFAFNSVFCNNGFYNPYYSYPIFPYDYSEPPPAQPAVVYDDSQSRALSLEVERLSDEIERMRDENRHVEQEHERAPSGQRDGESQRPAGLTEPPRVLVFKDGHQILAENYAVSGSTIWILDNGRVKKIPMTEVDMAATQKANADTDLRLRH